VRGQITQLPPGSLPEIQRVIAREGYVAPGARPLVGATYEHDDDDTTPRAASDFANLARLEAILPGAGARFYPAVRTEPFDVAQESPVEACPVPVVLPEPVEGLAPVPTVHPEPVEACPELYRRGLVLVSGRASLRATLPDRLPIVGAVNGPPGLYVAAGYASRGVVWAGLLGEALADRMTGQPLPLEGELMRAISPGRFTR
jgi:tRNA 5-methylaminomethyl-2-thiouridine biosynthesis bifunctional protein